MRPYSALKLKDIIKIWSNVKSPELEFHMTNLIIDYDIDVD